MVLHPGPEWKVTLKNSNLGGPVAVDILPEKTTLTATYCTLNWFFPKSSSPCITAPNDQNQLKPLPA